MSERRTRDAEHHPLDRKTDKSKFAVVNAKIAEYRSLFWLGALVLIALGFKYQTPSARIGQVEVDVKAVFDTVRVVKDTIESLKRGQRATHEALEVLARLRCFDTSLSNTEKLLAGLDCSEIDRARAEMKRDSVNRSGF